MALSLQRYTSEWRGVQSFEVGNRDSRLFQLLTLKTQAEREAAELISITAYNGHRVPKDLYIDILSWLPVKDVLRFKSVCKEWYAIISTPQFASKHLINNRYNNDNCLLAQYLDISPNNIVLFELLLDDTPRVLASKELWEPGQWHETELCGPCDGLYYLYNGHSFRAVWNPALNELRTLPPIITKPHPPVDLEYSDLDTYGFGCNPLTGDYKVVAIKGYWSTIDDYDGDITHPLSVLVYSLRTDSWKYCGDLAQNYILNNNNCYIFVKGCCFWLGMEEPIPGDKNYNQLIVSFDMASDTFQEIHLPDYQRRTPYSKNLGMYDDSLAFFSIDEDDGKFEIWTLNQGIWTKKFTVGHVPGVLTAFGHWKTNKVLLQTRSRKLVLCDPNTNEIKDLESPEDDRLNGVFAYMESLVSIKDKNKPEKAEDNGEVDADIV